MDLKINPINISRANIRKQANKMDYYHSKPLLYDSVTFSGQTKVKEKDYYINNTGNVLQASFDPINETDLSLWDFGETLTNFEKPKFMKSRANAVNHDLAKKIYLEALPVKQDFQNKLEKYFGTLVADEAHPDRPLAFRQGITTRTKSPASICEKTAALGLSNKTEIKDTIGDIIGGRLVIRDSSKIDEVVNKLIEGIRANDIKIFEIENYRPEPKYSYFNKKHLDALEKIGNKMRTNGVTRTEKSVPSGYTATHFSVYLPNGFKGELQIIGIDVLNVKKIEDMLYKLKDNKSLDPKYRAIEEHLKDLKTNKALQKAVTAYSKEQYIYALSKKPYGAKSKQGTKFLPAPAYVSAEYDFNDLYRMMQICERKVSKVSN